MQVGVSKAWVFQLASYNIFCWDGAIHPLYWWIVTIAAQKRYNKDACFLDNHHVGVEHEMLLISEAHQDINSLLTLKVMGLFEFLVLKYRKHSGYFFQPGWLLKWSWNRSLEKRMQKEIWDWLVKSTYQILLAQFNIRSFLLINKSFCLSLQIENSSKRLTCSS